MVADLVDPEAEDLPALLGEAAVAELIAVDQFAVPISVKLLAVDFNVKPSVAVDDRKVETILVDCVLRDRANACFIKRPVEPPLPFGDHFGI